MSRGAGFERAQKFVSKTFLENELTRRQRSPGFRLPLSAGCLHRHRDVDGSRNPIAMAKQPKPRGRRREGGGGRRRSEGRGGKWVVY